MSSIVSFVLIALSQTLITFFMFTPLVLARFSYATLLPQSHASRSLDSQSLSHLTLRCSQFNWEPAPLVWFPSGLVGFWFLNRNRTTGEMITQKKKTTFPFCCTKNVLHSRQEGVPISHGRFAKRPHGRTKPFFLGDRIDDSGNLATSPCSAKEPTSRSALPQTGQDLYIQT